MTKTYTKPEIEHILETEDFEYQRVDLPFGLHTKGDSRTEMADVIFPKSLRGKSILDVGAANGYYCFEAEARNASKVLGIDINDKRIRHAEIIKDIRCSKVEFNKHDIELHPLSESFDYVLLLNVIHHLKNPIRALHHLAEITNEKLFIEFPTISDPKFCKNTFIPFAKFLNRLPLIGVSSLSDRATDQTFLFSPPALKRILMDHKKLFKKIEFVNSKIDSRVLAICSK